MGRLLAAIALLALAACATGQRPQAQTQQAPTPQPSIDAKGDTAELLDMFGEVCLTSFPDLGAVQSYAAAKQMSRLPPERLREIPGSSATDGWTRATALGDYIVTVEPPPHPTCAIRKQFAYIPNIDVFLAPWLASWARTHGGISLRKEPLQRTNVGQFATLVYVYDLGRSGTETEAVRAFLTAMASGALSEVRLERALTVR